MSDDKLLYRVVLPDNHDMDVIYEIGCKTAYTGFWTTSLRDAENILDYVSNSYFLDVMKECQNEIIMMEYTNAIVTDGVQFKTDNNTMFDKNEVFVSEIIDVKKIKKIH